MLTSFGTWNLMVIITLLPLGSNDLISSAKLFSKSAGFPGRTEGDGGRLFSFACGKGFGKNLPASPGNVGMFNGWAIIFPFLFNMGRNLSGMEKKNRHSGKNVHHHGKNVPHSSRCPTSVCGLSKIRALMANVGLQEEADERIPGIPHLLARRCPWAVRKYLRNIFRMRHL